MSSTLKFAKKLRAEQTKAETLLWCALRNQQLGGFKFRRQVPRGPYVADFLCAEAKLIIEVDGATHGTAAEIEHDRERTAFLQGLGFRVIRFWNDDIETDLDMVLHAILLDCRQTLPRSSAD